MAILTSNLFTQVEDALGKQTTYKQRLKALDLGFSRCKVGLVARKKRSWRKKPGAKVRLQQQLWCDADAMWKQMTDGQRRAWILYYLKERQAGHTRTEVTRKSKLCPVVGEEKDMGMRAYFRRRVLMFDLLEYLRDYLMAEYRIKEVVWSPETYRITVEIGSRAEEEEMLLPWERIYIRGRW